MIENQVTHDYQIKHVLLLCIACNRDVGIVTAMCGFDDIYGRSSPNISLRAGVARGVSVTNRHWRIHDVQHEKSEMGLKPEPKTSDDTTKGVKKTNIATPPPE